jgi:hypothetical protein
MDNMTTVEFNEKYAAYLPKGWYGLDIDDKDVIAWLDNLFEHYLTKIEGFEYHQIKVKFGINDVRFYSNLNRTNVVEGALISAIEANISSILKLKHLKITTDKIIKELKDKCNVYGAN